MPRILYAFFIILFCVADVFAAQLPRYLGSERKFRSFIYNPNDVYRYIGHYTYQGFIEFDEGETISTISMGNPSLWLFESLGNRLFLKPVGEDNSETNMTVITNKKVYHFELVAREAKSIADKDLIFVVKFVYPDEKDKNIVQFNKTPPSDDPDLRDLSPFNFNYQYTGDNSIAPIKVFDNGEFTYFQFPKKNAELPAIFTVDAQGFESLINFRATSTYMIVERVAPQFTLRNGADIVCVYNMSLYASGRESQSTLRRADGSLNTKNFPSSASPSSYSSANMSPAQMSSPVQSIPGMPAGVPTGMPSGMPGGMPMGMGGAPQSPPGMSVPLGADPSDTSGLPAGLLPPMPGSGIGGLPPSRAMGRIQ